MSASTSPRSECLPACLPRPYSGAVGTRPDGRSNRCLSVNWVEAALRGAVRAGTPSLWWLLRHVTRRDGKRRWGGLCRAAEAPLGGAIACLKHTHPNVAMGGELFVFWSREVKIKREFTSRECFCFCNVCVVGLKVRKETLRSTRVLSFSALPSRASSQCLGAVCLSCFLHSYLLLQFKNKDIGIFHVFYVAVTTSGIRGWFVCVCRCAFAVREVSEEI